jgi:hypothetical protein
VSLFLHHQIAFCIIFYQYDAEKTIDDAEKWIVIPLMMVLLKSHLPLAGGGAQRRWVACART